MYFPQEGKRDVAVIVHANVAGELRLAIHFDIQKKAWSQFQICEVGGNRGWRNSRRRFASHYTLRSAQEIRRRVVRLRASERLQSKHRDRSYGACRGDSEQSQAL